MADTIKKVDNIYYLQIGVQGENVSREVQMDVTEWIEKYPNGNLYILFKRYNDQWGYPVATTYEDGILTWTPSIADTSVPGVGYAEVRLMDAATESVRKSRIIPTVVENSVSGLDGAEVPSPFREWTNQVLAAATAVEEGLDELAALAERTEDAADAAETAAAAAPTEVSSEVTYQVSASGDTVPTGTWLNYIPNVPQGNWLWSRTILAWNNGTYSDPIYAKTRIGLDGSGSVVSVNDTSPDANGNVDLGEIVYKVNNVSPDSSGNVALPVDAAPTDGSSNPVSSDGVYDALAGKQNTLTFDSSPTSGSTNPVASGGVYTALDGKVNRAGDTFTGEVYLTRENDYPSIIFQRFTDPDNGPHVMIQPTLTASGFTRFSFYQKIPGSTVWEGYRLPITTDVLTSSNVSYDILTSRPGTGSLYYAPGETYSTSVEMMISGYITNGVRNIHLGLWLPKSLEKISSISVTSLVGSMRGVNGYINGWNGSTNILTQSGITVTAARTTPNGIHINIGSTTDLTNATANTPVELSGKITLSFS